MVLSQSNKKAHSVTLYDFLYDTYEAQAHIKWLRIVAI